MVEEKDDEASRRSPVGQTASFQRTGSSGGQEVNESKVDVLRNEGYPKDRSFSSWRVLEVIGSHWPQYFKFVMLKETKDTFTLTMKPRGSQSLLHTTS